MITIQVINKKNVCRSNIFLHLEIHLFFSKEIIFDYFVLNLYINIWSKLAQTAMFTILVETLYYYSHPFYLIYKPGFKYSYLYKLVKNLSSS